MKFGILPFFAAIIFSHISVNLIEQLNKSPNSRDRKEINLTEQGSDYSDDCSCKLLKNLSIRLI